MDICMTTRVEKYEVRQSIAAHSPPLSVMTLGAPRERLTAPTADRGVPSE